MRRVESLGWLRWLFVWACGQVRCCGWLLVWLVDLFVVVFAFIRQTGFRSALFLIGFLDGGWSGCCGRGCDRDHSDQYRRRSLTEGGSIDGVI